MLAAMSVGACGGSGSTEGEGEVGGGAHNSAFAASASAT